MKIIGDLNKSTFLRVFICGNKTGTFIEWHENKDNLSVIIDTGATSVGLCSRNHEKDTFHQSMRSSPETMAKVKRINAILSSIFRCPNCNHGIDENAINAHFARQGGQKSKRAISPEAQRKMQDGRKKKKVKT